MVIETKYSINDLVWVMDGQKPRQLKIRQVSVTINKWHTLGKKSESYFLANGNTAFCHNQWYCLNKIFSSKEELLKSLYHGY